MQYSVRHRRRLRSTGEQAVPRTRTARGTGVVAEATTGATATVATTASAIPAEVRAEGTAPLQPLAAPVTEIVPPSVIRLNWQR